MLAVSALIIKSLKQHILVSALIGGKFFLSLQFNFVSLWSLHFIGLNYFIFKNLSSQSDLSLNCG